MALGTDAYRGLAALALALFSFGCCDGPELRPPARDQAEGPRPPVVDPRPAPPLRITELPTARPATNQSPVIPAGGPMPAQSRPILPAGGQAGPMAPADPATQLKQLLRLASERYAGIDSYIVRLRRREQVNGKDKPEEVLLFKFRKQPWSVHFKWLGPEGAGREVVYVKGQHDSKLHTLLAAGDMPFAPAGKRIALSPDNALVRSASRHAITEAGVGALIERLGDVLEANERGDKRLGTLTYLGPQKRPEFVTPLEVVEHALTPDCDPQMARGGRRLVFFDTATRLPVLVLTYDDRGQEVEYYCYDRFQFPVKLDDDDFNPAKLWRMAK